MTPRLYVDQPLSPGQALALPEGPARHVQVLRLQPGDALQLFDGRGGEHAARIVRMGRRDVDVEVGERVEVDRELPVDITLALGVPANERMDMVVEKATELGAAGLQPLLCERSVWRLTGERAERRAAHWLGVAVAAAEQCGRTRVPALALPCSLDAWLGALGAPATDERRWVLSLRGGAAQRPQLPAGVRRLRVLSGPEGGLTPAEETRAIEQHGFVPVTLGPRVLRADTAPLALLAVVGAGL